MVALTGHDDPATLERCASAGCRTVLVKPIRPLELKSQIAAWLGERAVAVDPGAQRVGSQRLKPAREHA